MNHRSMPSLLAVSMLLMSCATAADVPESDTQASESLAQEGALSPKHATFETALRIEPNAQALLIDETSAEQVDYYVFHATAGSYYEISTDNDTFSPDNVIALFDAEHHELARNDSGSRWPGDDIDARLVVRIPKTGEYYVRVEDLVTPPEFFASRFPLLFYHLSVREIVAGTSGYAVTTTGVVPALTRDEKLGYQFITLVGAFEHETETVTLTGIHEHALIARVHPGGAAGDGSSVDDATVTVTAPSGRVLASIECSAGKEHIRPPISDGVYRIDLKRHGAAGANPFYAIDLVLLPDNPSEHSEAANDTLAGAESLAFSGGTAGRALLLAHLPPGDVDYYVIPAEVGGSVIVSCEGEWTGSGVRGFRAELFDPKGALVGALNETEGGIDFEVDFESSGAHYLRLSSSSDTSANAVDPWVRCGIVVN